MSNTTTTFQTKFQLLSMGFFNISYVIYDLFCMIFNISIIFEVLGHTITWHLKDIMSWENVWGGRELNGLYET